AAGAALYIVPEEIKLDLDRLNEFYTDNRITISFLPTQLCEQFMKMDAPISLRKLLTGGDKLNAFVKKPYDLINNYGPTENTVVTSSFPVDRPYTNIPIGTPVYNNQVLILDKYNRLMPEGAAGELCISGDSLARGYLKQPLLTNEKFVDNPYCPGMRMYRTGDLARWLPDGNLEFLGRIDNQVKIRGNRIELGEIEARLAKIESISQSVVVDFEDKTGSKYLCAYIVSDSGLSQQDIKIRLAKELPEYMIPEVFVKVDEIPLTPNGKADRKALPAPEGIIAENNEYTPPETLTEERLVRLWEEVLGREGIGTSSNFFEIGGHSLRATVLASKIHREFEVELPLKAIFSSPTIKGLAIEIDNSGKDAYSQISPAPDMEYYPLSSAQKRLYLVQKITGESTAYNIPFTGIIEGKLELERFEKAIRDIIKRHEAFRTSFLLINGEPVQKVNEDIDFKLVVKEASESDLPELVESFVRPFDLSRAPLIRVEVYKLSTEKHVLFIDMHHIISDGTSVGIMIDELINLYEGNEIEPVGIQYKDFALWQNELVKSGKMKRQEEFWLSVMDGEIPVLDFPTDYKRPSLINYEGDRFEFDCDGQTVKKLKKIAEETGSTLFMVLLAAYNVLLYKYTGQDDLIVGTPVAGRRHSDIQNIIGMFVNTLALRNYPDGGKTFIEFIREVRDNTLGAFENQDYQFEELVEKLEIARDVSRNPLFDTMFSLVNIEREKADFSELNVIPLDNDLDISKFDISLYAVEDEESIKFDFEFSTQLFKKETIEKISGHFVKLLDELAQNPNITLQEADMLTQEERNRILSVFNPAHTQYPDNETLQSLFEAQAGKTPDRTALVFEDREMTYAELNMKSNQLAGLLSQKGVKPGTIAGIMVERSFEMLIGILGIIKAGGAYLPITPETPKDRTSYMLEDSKAVVLLTQGQFKDTAFEGVETILLDDPEVYHSNGADVQRRAQPSDLAYIIYTSGSTGKPKGVMIEHKSAVNILDCLQKKYPLTQKDTYLLKTAYTFDVSVAELFGWFFEGGRLAILRDGDEKDPLGIVEAIKKYSVTHINFVPSMFNIFTSILDNSQVEALESLRYIFLAGEAVQPASIKKFYSLCDKIRLENIYGPTESTIYATCYSLSEYNGETNVSIGKPMQNIEAYIVDKSGKLSPVGVPGELCLSGAGLARGYLNNPELTEEKFVDNPFHKGMKMYRTGDLARWTVNGNIEYMGRLDFQVKIRGFRIELGEIENELRAIHGVKEAIAAAVEVASEKALCAYLVSDKEYTHSEIRTELSRNLPQYMLPSYYMYLSEMPLNRSGKIDRKKLPKPEGDIETGRPYVAPVNETEERLVSLWQEILAVGKIGTLDNFFELGGHSLKGTLLVSRIHREFDVEMPLREIFTSQTVKQMAEYIISAGKKEYMSIQPAIEREYYPLSAAQRRLYILNQLDGGTAYNMPSVMYLEGGLEKEKFEDAFRKMIERHQVFRTSFETRKGEPVQIIHEEVPFTVEYIECGEAEARGIVESFVRPFDFAKAPLLRAGLVKISDNRHIFMLDMHHIISDGASMSIFVREFMDIYMGVGLNELKVQYKDYSVWQNGLVMSGEMNRQEEFWLGTLSGEIPVLQMPEDYNRPPMQSFEGDVISTYIDEELAKSVRELCRETGTTMYMTLLAAYNVLLSKYTGQEDIIVGSPIAGRHHADLENIIGMFVNTLAMRNYPSGTKSFKEFLKEVRDNSLKAYENQDYQFEELVDKLELKRDLSRNPLFDTVFMLINEETTGDKDFEGLEISPYEHEMNISKFDMTLSTVEGDDGIGLSMEYCTKLYRKETMENMLVHFRNVLREVTQNPDKLLSEVSLMTSEERRELLRGFNNTRAEYPDQKTIVELFNEQVAATPYKDAVVCGNRKLSYMELNQKANSLARLLKEKGAENKLVGLMTERSLEMVIGTIAILKAGGAYLPIDPKYPSDRKRYMAEDSKTDIMLTETGLWEEPVEGFHGEVIFLDRGENYLLSGNELENTNTPESIAYVMYTSGSTGTPKGVMVGHRNVVRLVRNTNYVEFKEGDRILQTGAIVFDASTFEVWGALLNGLSLYLADEDTILNPQKLEAAIREYGITTLWLTSPLFNQLAQVNPSMFGGIRNLLVGGDVLSPKHINSVREACRGINIINGYGPTENTTFSTTFLIDRNYEENIPIGKPINNSTVYIVDRGGNLLPVGVPGELITGGDGVAAGYLGKPELTNEKFVKDSFIRELEWADDRELRMYRTGDRARWLSDGSIEFLGRMDHQVKIRGFRIELGEIENQLVNMEGIKEAVITVTGEISSEKALCAYYTADIEITGADMRERLKEKLPDYMLPSYFIQLDTMPLNKNGKIDRNALPKPEGGIVAGAAYVAPESETEEKLAVLWQEVLGIERVGVNDNFFELGGHSLKATILVTKIHREFDADIPLRAIFTAPTVKKLAAFIENSVKNIYSSIKHAPDMEYYPLSSAQNRLYIIDSITEKSTAYNIPFSCIIEGRFDVERFENAVKSIIERHESFRTSFVEIDGEPKQKIHEHVDFNIEVAEASYEELPMLYEAFVQPFDLNTAPLMRVQLIKVSDTKHALFIDMHHIISDGTSMGIMIGELVNLYEGRELPQVNLDYRDFALWQNEMVKSGAIKKQEDYWLEVMAGELPVLELPTDFKRPPVKNFEGDRVEFSCDGHIARGIKTLALETGSTFYMVVLAAYNVFLSKYTGQEDIIVGTPAAGRRHSDLKDMIGMFVNTLAMRNYPHGGKSFDEFLKEVRDNTLKAYDNQDYQFEELIEKLDLPRDLRRNPLFDTMLSLQNFEGEEADFSELTVQPLENDSYMSKFDITLYASEDEEEIKFNFIYCKQLFKRATVEKMADCFVNVLKYIISNREVKLEDIAIISDEEREIILNKYGTQAFGDKPNTTISRLFEKTVEINPDNIAVFYEGQELTYDELNRKANALAHKLIESGVREDKTVAMLTERSVDMIVGIMAVLKAGGAYLPIDTLYPEHRIEYMLSDSGADILLIQKHLEGKVSFSGETVFIDGSYEQYSQLNPEVTISPDSMAYVIYTSGTTGKPKGVMVENKGLCNLVAGLEAKIYRRYSEKLKIALVAPYVFDASVKQIFPALLSGHTLCIVPEEARADGEKLLCYYSDNQIDVSDGTPGHLNMLVNMLEESTDTIGVRHFVIGGEDLHKALVAQLFNKVADERLLVTNVYGPTECTDVTTLYTVDRENIGKLDVIPIGTPIQNTSIYVLDKGKNPVPCGVAGELYIGGYGVARGYINKPDMTSERFIPNPFGDDKSPVIYRTGDLVRILEDGNAEYLGRADNQVKIRGYRIELGEIESSLLLVDGISEAAVVAVSDKTLDKKICAYIVSDGTLEPAEIKKVLAETLPSYMLPQYIVEIDKVPLTPNGKVDRKALPMPETGILTGEEYVAPENETEEKLSLIWKEVLGIEAPGVLDNFFELGGHSLKATLMVSRIYRELNVKIPLREVFNNPTIRGLAQKIDLKDRNIFASVTPAGKKDYYPLSPAQHRLYIVNQLDGGTSYNMPSIMYLEGELELERFNAAFREMIKRHEAFRTSFITVEGQPVQKIHDEVEFSIEYFECDEIKAREITDSFLKPFDFEKAPLLRAGVIKLHDKRHILMLDMHHIISDGASMSIFVKEFMSIYQGESLMPLKVQYKDYSVWQRELLDSGELLKQEEYWLSTMSGEIPVLQIPEDYKRPPIQSFEGDVISAFIGEELVKNIRELGRETGTTLYMTLLAAYNVLLSKYTGQEDIIVGSPIAGRNHADLENIIGMFVNTLGMRNYPSGTKSFKEFLKEVRDNSLKAYENQDYQFEELVDKLELKRDLSRNPLFDTVFMLVNEDTGEDKDFGGLEIIPYEHEMNISKFDMTLSAFEGEDGIGLSMEYCTKLYKKETIKRMLGHFENILKSIVKNPDASISEIDMLSEAERKEILTVFNDTKMVYPKEKTIGQLFEEQAELTPFNIAVVYGDEKLTYRELNEKANQLARVLRQEGVRADTIVGMMVERSIEMIVGIMGILKAGGAYMPIDPGYPRDRIEYMLKDSGTTLLLIGNDFPDIIEFGGKVLSLEHEIIREQDKDNLEYSNNSDNLAYIIYTSGSTGKPKGNLTTHYNVTRVVKNTNYIEITEKDVLLQLSNYAFDGSVFDIYGALLNGAKLVLVDKECVVDISKLCALIEKENTTVFFITTALFNALVDINIDALKNIKHVLFGGERVSFAHAAKALEKLGRDKIIHVYGPTESTVFATYHYINETDEELGTVPIGKPLANTEIYIVDKYDKLLPVGVVGELCISGDGLAKGYLNRPELTEEKFVKNPFVQAGVMYRTGDLAKWLPDGSVVFVGRIDHQVKIRGFRIELGEIENQLNNMEEVKEAIITVTGETSAERAICAYYTLNSEISPSDIREKLKEKLPDYMLPSYFMELDTMPLNKNGKIDRSALPKPEGVILTGTAYAAPENEIEEKLAELWQEILGVERAGVNDNFFELGGHSLKGTMLVARIHKEFDVEMPLREIFARQTIRQMAEYIDSSEKKLHSSIRVVEKREFYPLSAAQRRLYIIDRIEEGDTSYNVPIAVVIEGPVEKEKVENAFRELISRHESFRTSFEVVNGEPVQVIHEQVDFELSYMEVPEEEAKQIVSDFTAPFDLSRAPLIRGGLIKTGEDRYILLADMHHIISDGTSVGIFTNEFLTLLKGERLEPLKIQYKDYAVWQNELLGSAGMKKQEEYWVNTFSEDVPVLDFPVDYPRPFVQSHEGSKVYFDIDEETSLRLKEICRESECTIYMLLLASYYVFLSKYSGQEDIVVGTPVAGRSHADLENVMGMFVNTLAIRNQIDTNMKFSDLLMRVRDTSIKAFENQDYQFEELVEKLDIKRDLSRNPLFDVMFVLQNLSQDNELELDQFEIHSFETENETAKFDFTLYAIENENSLSFSFEYCTKLFRQETVERMAKHYANILKSIADNFEIEIFNIKMLSKYEKKQLVYGFNQTWADYPYASTIHGIFEEQVKKTPHNIAITFKESSMTYRELNEKANSLAHLLREKGVGSDSIVAVLLNRSPEMIIAAFGILKAGGAYLPIDPGYPEDRIVYMLSDSRTKVLLTKTDFMDRFEFDGTRIDMTEESLYEGSSNNPQTISTPGNLAYIIYTSGTT
ncbi:MAG: non-ribosomal peptide synthase/polyketide synthase, partial [Clostridiaceae bacterium]|nr:non-ribosomal peptide synthase/polyketide synthase [Clostridiaceae bacterium]